jgi:mannosyltransferase OCH1-like enzyme
MKNAKAAGFQVNLVNDSNLHQFIPKQTLDIVNDAIKNAKMGIMPQTKSDFVRLALLLTHGGIYLDSTYFFL